VGHGAAAAQQKCSQDVLVRPLPSYGVVACNTPIKPMALTMRRLSQQSTSPHILNRGDAQPRHKSRWCEHAPKRPISQTIKTPSPRETTDLQSTRLTRRPLRPLDNAHRKRGHEYARTPTPRADNFFSCLCADFCVAPKRLVGY